jgi:hypothetical protein
MLPASPDISGATSLRGLMMLGKGKLEGSLEHVEGFGSCTNFVAELIVSVHVD